MDADKAMAEDLHHEVLSLSNDGDIWLALLAICAHRRRILAPSVSKS
jgi:hypothetical protein